MEVAIADSETVSLYLDLKPNERVDLEVAAMAAIEWSKTLKAASLVIDPAFQYRVILIAAEPGSSKWLAKIERSPINQVAKDISLGWDKIPLVVRLTAATAAFVLVTAIPTYEFYFADDGFTDVQLKQWKELLEKVVRDPQVKSHRKAMYRELQRDKNITAVGGGIPDSPTWRPSEMLPANRFAEADGLFEPQIEPQEDQQRTIYKTLDVILVSPQLVNAALAWTFRQDGIPGRFTAMMKDARFLAALEASGIRETFRLNIPMRIVLEIKEIIVNGEWKLKRRGRSVVEVLSPAPDPSALRVRSATPER
ncbi:MAG: hypothetical protein ACOH2H_20265 [Cypionkella sp.]